MRLDKILVLIWAVMITRPFSAHAQNSVPPFPPQNASTISSQIAADSAALVDSIPAAVLELRGETEEARQLWLRRQALVEQALFNAEHGISDSMLVFHFSKATPFVGLRPEELTQEQPRRDAIDDALRRDQLGVPPLFNLGEALGKGLKYLAGKLGVSNNAPNPWATVPSATEVNVMKVLWKAGQATAAAIYAHVDSLGLTAKDLDLMLENMAARGWLERELISPQNEFTAFGVVTFEMSRKNAKNREYLYKPAVTRRDMLTFLDASAYSRRLRRAPGDDLITTHLRRMIAILASDDIRGNN
ncbi:hypothetical protein KJ068_26475 [bacterium]|nr:hypothetical protein [bacterium]